MQTESFHVDGDREIREAWLRGGVVLVHLLLLGRGLVPLRVCKQMAIVAPLKLSGSLNFLISAL